jgi:MFS family permease
MASEAKAADVPAAAPEAATVKPVEEHVAAPATTAVADKAPDPEAAPPAFNGNGVHAVQSEAAEKDIEGMREPSQKVCAWSRACQAKPPQMTFKKIMALVAMAFLWTGSQIPAYLYGGVPPYIYGDIGGADRWTWFILGYLFALGAVCPFVGSLSDLFGRRSVAIGGALLLIIGNIVSAKANTMNTFIAGMSLSGAGAGLCELTALAVTAELAPTRKRGTYVAILIFTILPFCPSVLWAQLIASHGSWRWIGLLCGAWSFIGLVLTVIFYFPPPRATTVGLSRGEIVRRIDFVGGFLSTAGLILFTAGVQWGGYQYPWTSAHVLAPLLIGIFLFAAFLLYEWKVAPYPMFPREMGREPRLLVLTLWITFVSGKCSAWRNPADRKG